MIDFHQLHFARILFIISAKSIQTSDDSSNPMFVSKNLYSKDQLIHCSTTRYNTTTVHIIDSLVSIVLTYGRNLHDNHIICTTAYPTAGYPQ